jgi:hypothetical protein
LITWKADGLKERLKDSLNLLDKQLKLIEENPYLFAESDKSHGLRKICFIRDNNYLLSNNKL